MNEYLNIYIILYIICTLSLSIHLFVHLSKNLFIYFLDFFILFIYMCYIVYFITILYIVYKPRKLGIRDKDRKKINVSNSDIIRRQQTVPLRKISKRLAVKTSGRSRVNKRAPTSFLLPFSLSLSLSLSPLVAAAVAS